MSRALMLLVIVLGSNVHPRLGTVDPVPGRISPVFAEDANGVVKACACDSADDTTPENALFHPQQITFGDVHTGDAPNHAFAVSDSRGEPFTIRAVEATSRWISVQWTRSVDAEVHGYAISVSLDPSTPIGELVGELIISTDHPLDHLIHMPVTARIVPDTHVEPEALFFGVVSRQVGSERWVVVRATRRQQLVIKRVHSSASCIAGSIAPTDAGRSYLLTARINTLAPTGILSEYVLLETDDPHAAQIKVPVYAFIRTP